MKILGKNRNRNRIPYDPEIPVFGIYPQNTKTLIGKDKCTLMFFLTCIQDMPNHEWIELEIVVYIQNEIIFSYKKGQNYSIFHNMDRTVKWS